MEKVALLILLSGLSMGASFKAETFFQKSEYGSLPNPRISFDETSFPNPAFSSAERGRYNEEYGKEYVKKYLLEYAKSRSIPNSILPAALILRELKELKPTEGSFPVLLKKELDSRMLYFETAGGIEFYSLLSKELKDLEVQLKSLKESAPQGTPAVIFSRYLEVKKKSKEANPVSTKTTAVQQRADDLIKQAATLRWYLRFGWLLLLLNLIGAFKSWRFVANVTQKRKMV